MKILSAHAIATGVPRVSGTIQLLDDGSGAITEAIHMSVPKG